MKTLLLLSLSVSVLLCAGCGASHAESTHPVDPTPAAVYKEGNGLQFTPGARELAGLETADVAEREIAGHGRNLAVPVSAVVRTIKGDFVYVANGPWFLRTPVTAGASGDGWVHIADGLYEGDTVVTAGARTLWLAELQAVNGGVGCADGK